MVSWTPINKVEKKPAAPFQNVLKTPPPDQHPLPTTITTLSLSQKPPRDPYTLSANATPPLELVDMRYPYGSPSTSKYYRKVEFEQNWRSPYGPLPPSPPKDDGHAHTPMSHRRCPRSCTVRPHHRRYRDRSPSTSYVRRSASPPITPESSVVGEEERSRKISPRSPTGTSLQHSNYLPTGLSTTASTSQPEASTSRHTSHATGTISQSTQFQQGHSRVPPSEHPLRVPRPRIKPWANAKTSGGTVTDTPPQTAQNIPVLPPTIQPYRVTTRPHYTQRMKHLSETFSTLEQPQLNRDRFTKYPTPPRPVEPTSRRPNTSVPPENAPKQTSSIQDIVRNSFVPRMRDPPVTLKNLPEQLFPATNNSIPPIKKAIDPKHCHRCFKCGGLYKLAEIVTGTCKYHADGTKHHTALPRSMPLNDEKPVECWKCDKWFYQSTNDEGMCLGHFKDYTLLAKWCRWCDYNTSNPRCKNTRHEIMELKDERKQIARVAKSMNEVYVWDCGP